MRDTASPDVVRIKQGSRWLWSQGDYPAIAKMLEAPAAELARGSVSSGQRVLDVAAGNGNFALAAARLGADVVATDLSPRMVDHGRARSEAEGLSIRWLEADAESLPFPDREFDVVASVFGAMFAPRPEMVASEMCRALRPGGTAAMVNYAGGYFERLSELIGRFSTSTTVLPSPFLWGDEDRVRERFGAHAASIRCKTGTLKIEFRSFDDWRSRFAAANPPLMAMKAMLPAEAYDGLERDAWTLAEDLNTASGAVVLESAYLTVLATIPRE